MIYLIEPYNAYQKPPKKKHWHEIAEEEALFAKIMQEAKSAQQTQNDSVNNGQTAASTAAAAAAGGAGGSPPREFFHITDDTIDFSASPTTAAAPVTVTFTNLTVNPSNDTFLWVFGDGTTSSQTSPTHVFDTGSFTVTLQVTNSALGELTSSAKTNYISASIPVVTASFSFTTSSLHAPFTAAFTNSSAISSQTPAALTYLWAFGDGTSSVATNPTHIYQTTGSFIVSLQATGSYNIASKTSSSLSASL